MRVILVCGAGIVSGKEIISLQLLSELKERGYECLCIVSSWGSEDFKNRLGELGIPFKIFRIGFISKTFSWSAMKMTLEQVIYLPKMYFDYVSLLRRFKPEIIIHTNFHHLFLFYPVVSSSQKNIYWSHEIISDVPFYRRLFRLFRRKVDMFIGVSQAVTTSLASIVGKEQTWTIRNGVLKPLQVITEKQKSEPLVLAIVGQVSRHKGHELLFNALHLLKVSGNFRLKVVGDGLPEYVQHLHLLSKELGLEDRIEWCGFVKGVDDIYLNVDWIVVPTINPEPLGLIAMEAGMRGIPAIASNAGGLPELIKDGENGYLFDSGNAESLSKVIQKVLILKNCEEFKERSRSIAHSNFGTDKFGDLFDDILKGLVKARND